MAKKKKKKMSGGLSPYAIYGKTNTPGTAVDSVKINKGSFGNAYAKVPAHAPYNFIPFCEKVHEFPKADIPKQNDMNPKLLSGEIQYMVTSLSPIFVNAGEQPDKKADFYKDAYDRFAIPGSTMRGRIRSNLQILGLANLRDEVQDQKLMYRNVAGAGQNKRERLRYQDILGTSPVTQNGYEITVIENVQGGYIENRNGAYYILRAISMKLPYEYGSMNYYTIRDNDDNRYGIDLSNVKDASYQEVWYSLDARGEISDLSDCEKPGWNKGTLLKSGNMQKKRAVYIIPEANPGVNEIRIRDEDINNFRIDYNIRENQLGANKGFYALPEEGKEKRKPVFFIELDGNLYFGFTPHLRIYYDYSIRDGMPHKEPPEDMTDYARAIFGEVSGSNAIKSRVSFTDAVIKNFQVKPTSEEKVILSSPKPSDYHDYLEPDKNGTAVSYNDKGFRLRGVKQYWLHEGSKPEKVKYDPEKDSVYSTMMPLRTGEVFTGKVRFRNLTKEELGLLLWSIRLKEGCQMNIGMAKPYGYGKIKLTVKSLSLKNLEKSYDLTKGLSLDTEELLSEERVEEYIEAYKKSINKWLNGRKIDDLISIRDFFSMKTPGKFDERDKPVYMQIEKQVGRGEISPNKRDKFNEFVEAHKETVLPNVREIDARRKKE